MQLRKLLLPGLLSVTLLSGCSLFNSEEDVVKMSPLPTVETSLRRPRPGAPPLAAVLANSTLTCTRLLLMALCMPPIVKAPLKP